MTTMTEAKSLNKDETAALARRIRQLIDPILEDEEICPCCVAHAMIATVMKVGEEFSMVPLVAGKILQVVNGRAIGRVRATDARASR